MAKLQAHYSREYHGTKYEKFWVVIPSKIIERVGWKKGQPLKVEEKSKKVIIEKEKIAL